MTASMIDREHLQRNAERAGSSHFRASKTTVLALLADLAAAEERVQAALARSGVPARNFDHWMAASLDDWQARYAALAATEDREGARDYATEQTDPDAGHGDWP